MMSATARAGRRGAIDRRQFLAELRVQGFVEIVARPGFLHEFVHRAAGERRFVMPLHGQTYSAALEQIVSERDRFEEHRPPTPDDLPPVTTDDMVAEVEREITLRRRVYPRWIELKKLSQQRADRQIAVLEAISTRLRQR